MIERESLADVTRAPSCPRAFARVVARAVARALIHGFFTARDILSFAARFLRALTLVDARRHSTNASTRGTTPVRAPRALGFVVRVPLARGASRGAIAKVADLASMCATHRVTHCVMYDVQGALARGRAVDALVDELARRALERGFTYVARACDAHRGGSLRVLSQSVAKELASVNARHVVIDVVGGRDACAALVEAARSADIGAAEDANASDDGRFAYKSHVERLERWMSERGSFLPPADAVIVFGETFTLDGFPPWQLHGAELYHEKSLERFTERDFNRIIDRYMHTAQRFGK